MIARISQTSGAIRSDQVRGVRGLGLKILGVVGPSGERADARFPDTNQDFVFVTEPAFLFRDAADYAKAGMRTARALTALPDPGMLAINRVLRAVRRVVKRTGRDLPAKLRVFAEENHHPLRQTFYTAAPVRFGDFVAKLRVAPSPATVAAAVPATIDDGHYDAASQAVASYFASKPAEYEVAVQLCTDEVRMPSKTPRWNGPRLCRRIGRWRRSGSPSKGDMTTPCAISPTTPWPSIPGAVSPSIAPWGRSTA